MPDVLHQISLEELKTKKKPLKGRASNDNTDDVTEDQINTPKINPWFLWMGLSLLTLKNFSGLMFIIGPEYLYF